MFQLAALVAAARHGSLTRFRVSRFFSSVTASSTCHSRMVWASSGSTTPAGRRGAHNVEHIWSDIRPTCSTAADPHPVAGMPIPTKLAASSTTTRTVTWQVGGAEEAQQGGQRLHQPYRQEHARGTHWEGKHRLADLARPAGVKRRQGMAPTVGCRHTEAAAESSRVPASKEQHSTRLYRRASTAK